MKVVYSRRALAQLAAIYEYLVERNPASARRVRATIATTIVRLAQLPRLGKRTDEADVHVLIDPEYLYRVFYRVDGRVVTVLRILHRSQQ